MSRLNKYRYFDSENSVRSIAYELFSEVKNLPIISPHGHTDPIWFAKNAPFSDPTSLLITPDHYVLRMLYSQGISLETLGVTRRDGSKVEENPRSIWKMFARHYYLFAGTPVGAWFDYIFNEIFEINETLTENTADSFYNHIDAALRTPSFLPRSIIDRYKIEVIATTDDATSNLVHHEHIRSSSWKGRVIPTFRPDLVTNILHPDWLMNIHALGNMVGKELNTFSEYILALESRRTFFKDMGATATDHGVSTPYTKRLPKAEAERIYSKALSQSATLDDRGGPQKLDSGLGVNS
jgi:glucuronate isomerase